MDGNTNKKNNKQEKSEFWHNRILTQKTLICSFNSKYISNIFPSLIGFTTFKFNLYKVKKANIISRIWKRDGNHIFNNFWKSLTWFGRWILDSFWMEFCSNMPELLILSPFCADQGVNARVLEEKKKGIQYQEMRRRDILRGIQ